MKETNMEHFRSEIEKLEYDICLQNGEIKGCMSPNCGYCDLDNLEDGDCATEIVRWLMSEYKPEPVLTEREKHFVEFAQEGWMARDESGYVYVYQEKPFKHEDFWSVKNVEKSAVIAGFKDDMFPFITWEDEEPWSVKELRKLKVENE